MDFSAAPRFRVREVFERIGIEFELKKCMSHAEPLSRGEEEEY
jgi:hypothetical protein